MSSFTERESELIQPHKYAETIKNFIHYDVVVGNLSTQQQIIWHLCCNLSLTLLIANMKLHPPESEFSHHFPKWDFILLKLNDSILLNEVNHTGTREKEEKKINTAEDNNNETADKFTQIIYCRASVWDWKFIEICVVQCENSQIKWVRICGSEALIENSFKSNYLS